MKRIIIAGTGSGCGKTTVTCAVMKALLNTGLSVASFKCGPDYIDPMFHEHVVGTSAHNLDSFFCDENTLKYLLHDNGRNSDISIIEGVMGFYDGKTGSAYSVSQITDTGVILVIDCKGMSDSIGAVIKGFLEYKKPNNIIGFIFNRLPERLAGFAENLCTELRTEYLGFLPKNNFTIESRHLGLVTADEITDLKEKISGLGELAGKYIRTERINELTERSELVFSVPDIEKFSGSPVIAVARDKAFCFIYQDNIALLEKYGCRIQYFSPLNDKKIPENASGLILSGGYPELYTRQLSGNTEMLDNIKSAVNSGIPTIAECGGFMYLHESMENDSGEEFPMTGIIRGKAFKTNRLQRFGYVNLKPETESMIFRKADYIAAHEFHCWDSTDCGNDLTAEKSDGRSWNCGHCTETMYAGFPHLYFYSDLRIAKRFIKSCIKYGETYGKN